MKVTITFIIALLFAITSVFGQRNLSKDEILKYWNSSPDNISRDSLTIVNSDSSLNAHLLKLIDSLHAQKTDSIIVFSTSYPGYMSNSKCDTGLFPITTFIIWEKDGENKIRKIKGACVSDVNKKSPLHLFDFYKSNYNKLKSESFMPAILGGQITKNGTITYSMSSVDHEPNYSFYYRIGNVSNSFRFRESYIDDKESLFQKYNLNLAIYRWWLSVKKELDLKTVPISFGSSRRTNIGFSLLSSALVFQSYGLKIINFPTEHQVNVIRHPKTTYYIYCNFMASTELNT